MKDTIEAWEKLFKKYRGNELALLYMEALRVGLRQGSITAEDLHHIPVENPNVRGACMRGLRRNGLFEKCGFEFGSTEQSHGHTMFVWRLANPVAAKIILDRALNIVDSDCSNGTGNETQMVFC